MNRANDFAAPTAMSNGQAASSSSSSLVSNGAKPNSDTTNKMSTNNNNIQQNPVRVEALQSFAVNQQQEFHVHLATHVKFADLLVNITNPILGLIDNHVDLVAQTSNANQYNKCRVTFKVPIVGVYTFNVELINQPHYSVQFQAKAYDLSKVFITNSSGKCFVNETYELCVDASEAGEGQLEIAVNEGEIPNQVQVLDNGKLIVNFVPEEPIAHVVDIKFNGHNVNKCPFVVDVTQRGAKANANGISAKALQEQDDAKQQDEPLGEPVLRKEERLLVNSSALIAFENVALSSEDVARQLLILDPENQPVAYKLTLGRGGAKYEFAPTVVGDHSVELAATSALARELPHALRDQFPFPLKVYDFTKVIVSEVTDGVIGHPIYFFIDASQAGSGNLEIRVSSKTRNVPNHPQSEANAKIRVHFTPTEAVDHTIDVKFNGLPVPGSPFLVRVAQYPQARLPIASQDVLKHVPVNELTHFYVDYIGSKENRNMACEQLTEQSCRVFVLRPDLVYARVHSVELVEQSSDKKQQQQMSRFKVTLKPTKTGPYKLFVVVNNEILPASPLISHAYDINEVKVSFADGGSGKPSGQLQKPFTFTVDASRAGEGTLALAVVSGGSRRPVQTDVKVSDKGQGLYNLTFVPVEFAPHTIDMSFNERPVCGSPFVVDILDAAGNSSAVSNKQQASPPQQQKSKAPQPPKQQQQADEQQQQLVQNFAQMSVKSEAKVASDKKLADKKPRQTTTTTTHKKSLAYGLINASNVVYLETGVLENPNNQVSLIGPKGEQVPFLMDKGHPQPGEPKKPYVEYRPRAIGTHTINVLEEGKDLRQYYVEICDPSRIRVVDLAAGNVHTVGRPVTFCIDARDSGEIQLDSISIMAAPSAQHQTPETLAAAGGKHARSAVKNRDSSDYSILSKIKSSMSSPGSSHKQQQQQQQQHLVPIEYVLTRVNEHKQEVKFTPPLAGKYSIDIRCLGQSVGASPYEIDVVASHTATDNNNTSQRLSSANTAKNAHHNGSNNSNGNNLLHDGELLNNIAVHGVSLKSTLVNSTGAFIIDTNRRLAHAQDFDVIITDASNNPVAEIKCYSQQDGNLLVEWTPERVGPHRIEVLYKDRHVPGSPFVSEAFDSAGVIIESIKSHVCQVNELFAFKLNAREAGVGELDVVVTAPNGDELPVELRDDDSDGDDDGAVKTISFTPSVPGKHQVVIWFAGYEVPKMPLVFTAIDKMSQDKMMMGQQQQQQPVRVSGAGLRSAEVNRSAQFQVDTCGEGELKLRIELGDREIVPKVERRANSYSIKYKPTEVGYASVSLYWNGVSVANSPYSVPVCDLTRILFLSGTSRASQSNNQRSIVDYEPRQVKEITIDTSKCGPGDLKAEAYCRANPSIKFNVVAQQYAANKYKLLFALPPKPEQCAAHKLRVDEVPLKATYLIRLYYNNLIVPETLASVIVSPAAAAAASVVEEQPPAASRASVECPVVALRGHGLVDARCGDAAEFTIDGTQAGPGVPEVSCASATDDIQVRLEPLDGAAAGVYQATYVPQVAGLYSLNVLWDGKQVAGCPISVNVVGHCDPAKVVCTGDGLKGGVMGEEIKTFIDTRRAGPGELTALCAGPNKVAFCELLDRADGTFILYIKPQEAGKHVLTIKYAGQHIAKSPFVIKVSGRPDPSKVRVYGPGVEHGVLSLYQSRFVCDTRGAGAGQLTVRIRGPKGAFRMETQRESQRDRTILCKYDPTEPGDYRIEIKWSGKHVPGSPFSVMIFDTQEELNRFLISGSHGGPGAAPGLHSPPGAKLANAAAAAGAMMYRQPMLAPADYGAPYGATMQKQPPFRL